MSELPEGPAPDPGAAPAGGPDAWWPAPRHVSALMSARFPGGITESSSPTEEQVRDLIAQLVVTVCAECDPPGVAQESLARATVALGVASYIENSSYPEQVDLTSSPAEFYRRRYAEHVELLRAAIVTGARARTPALTVLSVPVRPSRPLYPPAPVPPP